MSDKFQIGLFLADSRQIVQKLHDMYDRGEEANSCSAAAYLHLNNKQLYHTDSYELIYT